MPFKKGQSGNPGGRPKKTADLAEVERLAQEASPAAIKALSDIVRKGEGESARVAAANAILDRAYGKARQTIEATVTERMVVEAPQQAKDADEWAGKYGVH